MTTSDDVVLFDARDGIGLIVLNRPERRNALHRAMYDPIKTALAEWAADDAIGCIVLTGAGTSFCAGGDVRDGAQRRSDGTRPNLDKATAALLNDAQTAQLLYESPKITLAAVNGAAVGAGMSLALACDFRILAASARFIPGWGELAFSGDFGGTWLLTRLLGASKALEILTSNTTVSATDATTLGLANRIADDDTFADDWRRWAGDLAQGPRHAHEQMKANVRDAVALELNDALPRETARQVSSSRTDEHKAAVRAWLARHQPQQGNTP